MLSPQIVLAIPILQLRFLKANIFLLGDDRIVSKDREVGTFKESDIIGEVKFRFWPLTEIGTVK